MLFAKSRRIEHQRDGRGLGARRPRVEPGGSAEPLGDGTLSRGGGAYEEEYWLAGPRSPLRGPRRRARACGALDRTQLSSSVLECIRGSGPCLELGDRAAQSWPPGGTGRPIAVSSVSSLQDEILIKMIIGVDHGAMDIKVPCNMQPFSFGSGPPPFALQPYPGFYSHPKTKVLASRREAAKGLGLLAETIARDLARLYWIASRRTLCSARRWGASSLRRRASRCWTTACQRWTRRSDRTKKRRGDRSRVDRPAYLVYHFSLGAGGQRRTPAASSVTPTAPCACEGLSASRRGCDSVYSRRQVARRLRAVSTAARDYGRALREVDSAFGHLTAVVNTRVGRNVAMDSMESGLPLSHSPDRVDVMMDHRALIEETRAAAISTARRFAARGTEDGVAPLRSTGKFLGRMNSWKSGALLLSFQLNSATFALIGARERLLACARGVLRSDMTGCAPGFRPEFYTDVPAASRSPPSSSPSSGLVLEVRRDRWNPVSLSRWYMAYVDSSQGNRTCWLDRSMLNDSRSDYREPICDRRGLCDPLELDDDTLAACDVRRDGEVSSECPLACGSPCFGPLCYKRGSSSYELRVAVDLDPESAEILVASEPRILSKAYSVSEEDARASLAQMRERAGRALEQLDRGVSVVHALKQMNSKLRSCADRIDSGNVKCLRETDECRRSVVRGGAAATASLVFSAITTPLLIVLILKLRC
ncbi:hypothetical protein Q5P01_000798 [Channa striata]|uniref:Uncharacterized protein n=1 Tax=Channa striata TaxID=64152 RepID=A0AA88ID23_CHASR|nr:hypothetical protein Q5P01_000798 [Channa striata]